MTTAQSTEYRALPNHRVTNRQQPNLHWSTAEIVTGTYLDGTPFTGTVANYRRHTLNLSAWEVVIELLEPVTVLGERTTDRLMVYVTWEGENPETFDRGALCSLYPARGHLVQPEDDGGRLPVETPRGVAGKTLRNYQSELDTYPLEQYT